MIMIIMINLIKLEIIHTIKNLICQIYKLILFKNNLKVKTLILKIIEKNYIKKRKLKK